MRDREIASPIPIPIPIPFFDYLSGSSPLGDPSDSRFQEKDFVAILRITAIVPFDTAGLN